MSKLTGRGVITAASLFMQRYENKLGYPYYDVGDFLVRTSHGICIKEGLLCASVPSVISRSKDVMSQVQDRLLFHTYFCDHLNSKYDYVFEKLKDPLFDKLIYPSSGVFMFSHDFEDRISKLAKTLSKYHTMEMDEETHEAYRRHVLELLDV